MVWCDLPGFGQTLLPSREFSYAEEVLALVDGLGLESIWLLGASFGGQVAIDFCLAYPNRVQGLILATPAIDGFEPTEDVQKFGAQEDMLLERGKLEEATELNLRMWVDGPQRTARDVDPALRKLVGEMQFQAFSQPEPENVSLRRSSPPAIERLAEIQAPTLIISGGLDVPAFNALAETIANGMPNAKRVVVPNTAHLVSMEAPEQFNQQVLAFIAANKRQT